MPSSVYRILTTHVGSLPRTKQVTDLIFAQENGDKFDAQDYKRVIAAAVHDVVDRQVKVGVDLVSDGEQSKLSDATYIKDRITGFEGDSPRQTPQDPGAFSSFMKRLAAAGGTPTYRRPRCTGPIAVKNHAPLNADIADLHAAIKATPPTGGIHECRVTWRDCALPAQRFLPDANRVFGSTC